MDYAKLLDLVTEIGEGMLENGAEIYRVEESLQRMLEAYGIQEVESFAVQTAIIVTIVTPQTGPVTRLRRIRSRGTNLDMVDQLNGLSRKICASRPSLETIRGWVDQANARKPYPFPVQVLAYSLVAFSFALLFGGTGQDALCAAAVGALLKIVCASVERFPVNGFFVNLLGGAVTAAFSLAAVRLGLAIQMDKVVISVLMNMVPGVAITNSMRDIMAGDLMAGQTKLTEALFAAVAMAAGSGMALSLAIRL